MLQRTTALWHSVCLFSVSDLGMPANELVRLVRVYSTPWEEKSAALKKLHEDYEGKQRQLNIAIKRLQLVDAHVGFQLCFLLTLALHTDEGRGEGGGGGLVEGDRVVGIV